LKKKNESQKYSTCLVEENNDKVHIIDEDLQPLGVHILDDNVLLGGVLVLEEELEDLLLVVDVPGVEDGCVLPEEGEGGQAAQGVILGQGRVNDPYKPSHGITAVLQSGNFSH
jgi:hypothetical protein